MIKIENLSKNYGSQFNLIVDDMIIPDGQILGIVGNNGAGKTTLLSLLLDLIKARNGKIFNESFEVSRTEDWKKFTGAYINETFLLNFLTADEYFEFVADLYSWGKDELNSFLESFVELFNGEVLNKKKYIRDLSKGNQKKVGIVAALIGHPKVIILDEPFANLDPTSQIQLKTIIKNIHNPERTFLISSHDLGHVAEVCDRIVVLEDGNIVKDLMKSENTLNELYSYFQVQL